MSQEPFLNADQVIAKLGINKSTLYAYVSRGMIRSENIAGTKQKRYRLEDVETLQERKMLRKSPEKVLSQSLHWGAPLLESEITLIQENMLFYRGQSLSQLVEESFESVLGRLWQMPPPDFSQSPPLSPEFKLLYSALAQTHSGFTLMEIFLPYLEKEDRSAFALSQEGIQRSGLKILHWLLGLATGKFQSETGFVPHLQLAWCPQTDYAGFLLNRALILCMDHELNISTFTTRCAFSAGSSPYGAIQAGLAALKGFRHGGNLSRVELLFQECEGLRPLSDILAERLKRGEALPGFGHPLYPGGDPRWRLMQALFQRYYPQDPEYLQALRLEQTIGEMNGEKPNLDFALVTLRRLLGLREEQTLSLFALGRCVGWIAHILEQARLNYLIRPRSRYIGPLPAEEFN